MRGRGTDKTDFLLKKGPMENTHNGYISVNPNLEAAISDLENANKSDNVEDIRAKMDALMKAMGPISQRVYQEASQQQGPKADDSGPKQSGGGDYVDADYKIVDDE